MRLNGKIMLWTITLKYIESQNNAFRDTRPDARSDAQNYCFKNVEKQILVKEQGQICGQAFTIDNCSVSVNGILWNI